MAKNNGGQAFPLSYEGPATFGNPTGRHAEEGMSLRDYFAAHAPFTLADARGVFHDVEGNYVKPSGNDLMKILVDMRIGYADDMLAKSLK